MATTYLNKTLSGSRTNGKKWTWSAWVKRSKLGSIQPLFYADDGSSNYYTTIRFHDTDSIVFRNKHSSDQGYLITTPVYRDPAAWYHIVAVYDSDNSTSGDRMILYVNGERITAYDNEAYPGSSAGSTINDGYEHRIGRGNQVDGSSYFDGLMSHVHFSDGYVYDASTFGETDSTTGEWKIKTSPSITMGINGFTVLKDGNTITDQSSNSNDWSLGGGTLTPTEDCPDNVFPAMNPLLPGVSALTFENGNLHNGDQSPNDWQSIGGTMAAFTGKFYWEFKIEGVWGSTSDTTHRHGIANLFATLNHNPGNGDVAWTDDAYAIGWKNSSGVRYNNSSTSGYGTYVANDILMFAMDLTNKKLYFGKNGTWLNSGDPTSGSSGTGAYSMPDLGKGGIWGPYSETKYGSDKVSWNMGNGYFKSTAISSEGTNASGIGKFEYDVPTGYTALSTKGLNE